MRNYNEDFFRWLARVREQGPKSVDDVPEELQKEFEKLMLLAAIPFREIFGSDPQAVTDLLRTILHPSEIFDESGALMKIVFLEPDRVFVGPANRVVAQPPLYAEDSLGRCFVFLYCDHRGPAIGEAAAVFDAIQQTHRDQGAADEDLPDVYFIYLTDYDIGRQGRQIMRLDPREERDLSTVSDEAWRAKGCDPAQPDPVMSKWHTIFFNAAMTP